MTRSSTGNWVRNNVTWSSLEYLVGWRASWGATSYRAEHISLLRELRALARLYDNRRWVSSGDEAVWLESVGSRRLWDLLGQASELGLYLVAAGRSAAPVTLSPEAAAAELDAALDGSFLKITPRLVHGGRLLSSDSLLLVGDPPHGLVCWEGTPQTTRTPALLLAPLSQQLSAPAGELIRAATTIEVPAKEVNVFEAELLPRLRRRLAVTSCDASYAPPPTPADVVVCYVTHGPGPSLELAWGLEQGGSRRRIDDEPDETASIAMRDAAELLSGLAASTVTASAGPTLTDGRLDGIAAARFVSDTLPQLSAIRGVRVEQIGEAPDFREVPEGPTLRIGGGRSADGDWLDLAVEVTVEGEKVSFEALFVALAEGASHMFLPSGAWFSLERDDLRRLAELIVEARSLHDAPSGGVRLSRYQSSIWEDLSEVAPVDSDISGWADGLRALASPPPPPPVPESLKAQLRPYQTEGFAWLASRYAQRVGGILADDMGLGKTLQALALICHARESSQGARGSSQDCGPFLVVAPTSVVSTWAGEAARFAPDLKVVTVSQTTAKSRVPMPDLVSDAGLVVTSYALFRLDFDRYEALSWAGLLLDEAQFVKNPASHAYQRVRRLSAPWKLAMTGTPLENSLSELWALTSITAPGLFGRLEKFSAAYKIPIERNSDAAKLEALRRRIKPIMLRRTKSQVVSDLPDKQEQVIAIELDARHRRLYDTWLARERQKVLGLLGDLEANRFEIFRSLTLLRQAALDVSLVDPDHKPVPSAKLDMLSETLSEAVSDGHRALVFSQFTRFLRSAQRRLEDDGVGTCYLDGRTRKRAQVIEDFRTGKAPVFLISLKAGGFGLNLTEADHCILLDPWWNPATEAQAIDRVHRIGQTRKVIVYRYVASGTIEEKVMALKARKAELFAGVMDSGGFESASLSASDIEALLS
ncbi:MAG: DEAD/DEAH box helicase [Acidimicrobiales bacterium]